MATIPGVSDGELVRTSWGDAVADELNINTVKKTGNHTMAGQLTVASDIVCGQSVRSAYMFMTTGQYVDASAATRKDYVDGRDNAVIAAYAAADTYHYNLAIAHAETKIAKGGDTVNGTLTWNGDPYAGNHGTAVQAAAIAVNTHGLGNSNLWLMHSGDAYASGNLYTAYCGQTGGAIVGAVIQSGGSVSYFAASDYRLKHDLGPVEDPVGRLMALQPKHLRWKEGGQEFDGFIAHEVQEVAPYAVTGQKDDTNPNGSIKAQMFDDKALVSLLTAALQEAHTKIADLTARIEALEAA